jgi:hypothetical protein
MIEKDDEGYDHIYDSQLLSKLTSGYSGSIEEFGTSLVYVDFDGWESNEPWKWRSETLRIDTRRHLASSLICTS